MQSLQIVCALVAALLFAPAAVFAQTCYTCSDTVVGGPCATVTGLTATACSTNTCFRRELTGGLVARGCTADLTIADLATCTEGNSGCKLCTGDLCNAKVDFQRCHRCSSVSEDCPQLQAAAQNNHLCNDYMDQCAVQISGAATVRGCLAEMTSFPATCNALTCTTCTANFCNGVVFPTQRQQCHQCTGTSEQCMGAITGNDMRRVCDNYVQSDDMCFATFNANGQGFRGCISDNSLGVATCNAAGAQCHRCYQAGCNSEYLRRSPTLSCIQCNPFNPLCAWGFRTDEAAICENQVFMGQTEACFQRAEADGTVQRGCTLDNPAACPEGDQACTLCTSDGCNRQTYNAHSCYQCRSSDTEDCRAPEGTSLEPTACPSRWQQLDNAGCYVLEQDNGNVVRGCTFGLEESLLRECEAGDRCEMCPEDGCNGQPFGAAGALKALSVGLLALIAFMVQRA